MNLNDYIKPELVVLIPVLYIIGMMMKNTKKIDDRSIPSVLGCIGVVLSLIWTIGCGGLLPQTIFLGLTQGVLVAGAAVYTNQIIKQARKEKDSDE